MPNQQPVTLGRLPPCGLHIRVDERFVLDTRGMAELEWPTQGRTVTVVYPTCAGKVAGEGHAVSA